MDEAYFDDLTRVLAVPSRRSLFAAMATAIGAALFGADANDEALAKRAKRKRGKRAKHTQAKREHAKTRRRASHDRLEADGRKNKKKKNKKRAKKRSVATAPPAGSGSTLPPSCVPRCTSNACGAPNGCGGTCPSGSCPIGQLCQNGQCVNSCDAGFTLCGSQCVDTQTNSSHCGGCNQSCAVQEPETCGTTGDCAGGTCARYGVSTVCGQPHCDQTYWSVVDFRCDGDGSCWARGIEDCRPGKCDSLTGQCALSCSANGECCSDWCDNGTCRYKPRGATCSHLDQCLNGFCIDGVCCNSECITPPNAQRTCAGGFCAFTCLPGYGNCDNDLSDGCETRVTSTTNCGQCGNTCTCDNGLTPECQPVNNTHQCVCTG
jgi:hypothetical protein